MCTYHGGKRKIGKEIAEIIYRETKTIDNFSPVGYCEPFCGMLGVYAHIPELYDSKMKYPKMKYLAGDLNKSTIEMWKASQGKWNPPRNPVSKEDFNRLKKNPRSSPKKGFIGHIQSFRGRYFGGYSYRPTEKTYLSTGNRVKKIARELKKVKFKFGLYTQYSKLKRFIIYCDPPYENTQQGYKEESTKKYHKFNSSKFWEWCRDMAVDNVMFISSYSGPGDAELVWSKGREKLYMMY